MCYPWFKWMSSEAFNSIPVFLMAVCSYELIKIMLFIRFIIVDKDL